MHLGAQSFPPEERVPIVEGLPGVPVAPWADAKTRGLL
jgi:hypothetical protein